MEAAKVVLNIVEKAPIINRQTLPSVSQPAPDKKPELPASKAPLKKPESLKGSTGGGSAEDLPGATHRRPRKEREPSVIGVMDDSLHRTESFIYVKRDGTSFHEITELVSPRPVTTCFFNAKLYGTPDLEKDRNTDALKSGRMLSLDEEWEEGENDWLSGDEDGEDEQCIIS